MVAASPCALAVAPLAYATAISSLAIKVLFQSFSGYEAPPGIIWRLHHSCYFAF